MYLEIKDVKKSYGKDASFMQVLKGITTGVEKGQMCVIQGTSGSGKSTLLNCIGDLDTMDSGSVKVDGKEIFGLSPDALSDYRRDNLGFIFQFYNLVPNLTVRENIQVCEYLAQRPLDMDELLETLDLQSIRTNSFHSFQAVSGIADYSAGLTVFMDIDSMRELFGKADDYYNTVFSDKALDIAEGRLYSVTTKADVERSSDVFISLMMPMIIMLIAVAAVIFFAVMYLMMNVMIDRAAFGISLIKVFGFRTKEIKKLYLNGNFYVIAAEHSYVYRCQSLYQTPCIRHL